jgi:hypothetical protein
MVLAGRLARLFVAQGLLGIFLAVMADGHYRPAAAWVLAFLGVVLLSTGMLLWLTASEAEDDNMRQAEARGRQRAAADRNDSTDQ